MNDMDSSCLLDMEVPFILKDGKIFRLGKEGDYKGKLESFPISTSSASAEETENQSTESFSGCSDSAHQQNNVDKYKVNSVEMGRFKRAGTIEEEECLYRLNNEKDIAEYKKTFIQSKLRHEFTERNSVERMSRENRTLSFILNELVPKILESFNQTPETFYENIKSQIQSGRRRHSSAHGQSADRDVGQMVEQEKVNVSRQYPEFDRHDMDYIFVSGKRVWKLAKQNIGSESFAMDGEEYHPVYKERLSSLKERYEKDFEKKLKLEALDEDIETYAGVVEMKKERESMEKFFELKNFKYGDYFGWEKKRDNYDFFIWTGDYCLMNRYGDIIHMGNAEISVKISCESGRIKVDKPFVRNDYMHPGLSGYGSEQTVCMGNNSRYVNGYRYDIPGESMKDRASRYLFECKFKFMNQMDAGGGHNNLADSMYERNKITREEAERNGWPITNENIVVRVTRPTNRQRNYGYYDR